MWYKDDIVLNELHLNVEIQMGGSLLVIKAAQPRDSGLYRCVAENTVTDLGLQHVRVEDASASLFVIGEDRTQPDIVAYCFLEILFLCLLQFLLRLHPPNITLLPYEGRPVLWCVTLLEFLHQTLFGSRIVS